MKLWLFLLRWQYIHYQFGADPWTCSTCTVTCKYCQILRDIQPSGCWYRISLACFNKELLIKRIKKMVTFLCYFATSGIHMTPSEILGLSLSFSYCKVSWRKYLNFEIIGLSQHCAYINITIVCIVYNFNKVSLGIPTP